MIETPSNPPTHTRATLDRSGVKRIIVVISSTVFVGVLLFASAGRLDWAGAWIYLAIGIAGLLLNAIVLSRRNPEVINERGRGNRDAKDWDKALMNGYAVLMIAMPIAAGLDVRNGWSSMPPAWPVVGCVLMLVGNFMSMWPMWHNAYLATHVRIQEERGHKVVTDGPYRYVRHPMYVGLILTLFGAPLLWGSWWALVFGGLCTLGVVVRTVLEDRTLQAELEGYKEYAQRVRYRLLPGVW